MGILQDKVAIITGGAKGVGRSTALAYAREGAKVVINSRTRDEVQRTVQEILQGNGEAIGIVADVSQPKDVDRLVEDTMSRWGGIDILVNNAGVVGPAKPVGWDDVEQWRLTIEINLFGCYLMIHRVIPTMVKQQSGKIISVSSPNSLAHRGNLLTYAVSKAGLVRLSIGVAAQNARYGVDVNVIDVVGGTGLTKDIASRQKEDPIYSEWFRRRDETGLLLNPDVNIPLMLWLASPESDGFTGRYVRWAMSVDDLRANKERLISSDGVLQVMLNIPDYIGYTDMAQRYAAKSAEVLAQIEAEFAAST